MKRREGQRGRGWRGAGPKGAEHSGIEVPEEGSVKELVSGCKELGREGRDNGGKNLGAVGGGILWNVGIGMASEAATPLCRGEKQPQEGHGLPRAPRKQRSWRALQGSEGR